MENEESRVRTDRKRWLDDPANVRKVYIGLWVISLVLLALDLVYEKHAHYPAEELFGFYAFFGFLGFAGLVMGGKLLRRFVKRDEDYYDR
jgi:hypothetical protein